MRPNPFLANLEQFNKTWGIKREPTIEQAAHMLAVFGLELLPDSRPIPKLPEEAPK